MAPPNKIFTNHPTVVRLAAGVYGHDVKEADLHEPPGNPNWEYEPQFGNAGHHGWIYDLFSGDAAAVQRALNLVGIAQSDQQKVKDAVAKFLYDETRRRPMVLPVAVEV